MGAVRCQIECYSGCALQVSGCVVKAECGPVVVPNERDYAAASMWKGGKVNAEAGMRKVRKSEPKNRRMSNIECRREEFYRFYKIPPYQ